MKPTNERLSGRTVAGGQESTEERVSEVRGGRTNYVASTMRKWIGETHEQSPQRNDDKSCPGTSWHLTWRKKVG